MNKMFPTLFKKTSTGALQSWAIEVNGACYATIYGQVDGIITRSAPTVCFAKSVGRANATTAEEQAMLEAQSLWEKQLKRKGYVESADGAMAGEESEKIAGGIWPMLAEKYRDYSHKVEWPCYWQLKLNGHRMIAIVDGNGKCTLWTRKRNQYHSLPHIVKAIEALGLRNVCFDGEAYNYELVRTQGLEALSHLVRQSKPIPGHEVVQYWIYDAPLLDKTFAQRIAYLDKTIGTAPKLPFIRVRTTLITNEDDALDELNTAMDDVYEGIMLRNASGMYKSHPTSRSKDLLKLKGKGNKMDDGEFKVVGVKEGAGRMAGKAIFICVTAKGVNFDVKMKGNIDKLKEYWDHPNRAIGRMLTVQHVGWTEKGKPWFPVGLQFCVAL